MFKWKTRWHNLMISLHGNYAHFFWHWWQFGLQNPDILLNILLHPFNSLWHKYVYISRIVKKYAYCLCYAKAKNCNASHIISFTIFDMKRFLFVDFIFHNEKILQRILQWMCIACSNIQINYELKENMYFCYKMFICNTCTKKCAFIFDVCYQQDMKRRDTTNELHERKLCKISWYIMKLMKLINT